MACKSQVWEYASERGKVGQGDDYKFKGCPMSPSVFGEDLIALFNMRQFQRQTAIDEVYKFHSENGGLAGNAKSAAQVFKATTQKYLKPYMENVARGLWRLRYEPFEGAAVFQEDSFIELYEESKADNPMETAFVVDEVIGVGDGSVYVYYYPTYKQLAELKNEYCWPCKIGMTDGSLGERIMGQSSTAYPEYLHIGLEIKCDAARDVEKAVHAVLALRGKLLCNAPGSEWYLTNPEEVKSVYQSIVCCDGV